MFVARDWLPCGSCKRNGNGNHPKSKSITAFSSGERYNNGVKNVSNWFSILSKRTKHEVIWSVIVEAKLSHRNWQYTKLIVIFSTRKNTLLFQVNSSRRKHNKVIGSDGNFRDENISHRCLVNDPLCSLDGVAITFQMGYIKQE